MVKENMPIQSKKSKKKSKIWIWIPGMIVVIALAGVIGYIFQDIKNREMETQETDVTIGYSTLRISLPVFAAYENGYFEKEGLNVKLERFETAQPLMEALVTGFVDIAGYTALPITYNCMLNSNKELYFVTALMEDQDHLISYFLVPVDAPKGIRIPDLKGKKIGILPTVAYQKWLEVILKENGLNPEDVKIVPVAPTMQPTALRAGEVDALFTNDPAATTAIQNGIARKITDEALVPKHLGEPFIFGSFNIDKTYADNHPEAVEKVARALNKAVQFVNENPGKARQAMKKFVHKAQEDYVEFYPDAYYKKTTEVTGKDFQKMADQYLEIGIIPSKLVVKELLYIPIIRE